MTAHFRVGAAAQIPWFRHAGRIAAWAMVAGRWRVCVYPLGLSARRAYAWRDLGEVIEMVPEEASEGAAEPPDGLVRFPSLWTGWRQLAAHMVGFEVLAGMGLEVAKLFRFAPWL